MPHNLEIALLKKSLRETWIRETSSDPVNWSDENPAWGQCAVTACVVQDRLGGDVVWANAQMPDGQNISHYFNRIDGLEIDMTREQFPPGTEIPEGVAKAKEFPSTRDYVLSFPVTRARYDLLKKNLV